MRSQNLRKGSQQGVALAVVVWFVAGMSLLVLGIVTHSQVDSRMTQLHLAKAKVTAAGDGAIKLMMVDTIIGSGDDENAFARSYRFGGHDVRVFLTPTSGLINVEKASVEMLAALFIVAGRLNQEEALDLANTIVFFRDRPLIAGGIELNSLEDLVRIPGSSRTLVDSIRDLVVLGNSAEGGMSWSQAPDGVLAVLAQVNPSRAESVLARREDAIGSNPARAARQSGQGGFSGTLRADAMVQYGDEVWLRRRWITMKKSADSKLPWHYTRTEAPRVLIEDS